MSKFVFILLMALGASAFADLNNGQLSFSGTLTEVDSHKAQTITAMAKYWKKSFGETVYRGTLQYETGTTSEILVILLGDGITVVEDSGRLTYFNFRGRWQNLAAGELIILQGGKYLPQSTYSGQRDRLLEDQKLELKVLP